MQWKLRWNLVFMAVNKNIFGSSQILNIEARRNYDFVQIYYSET